MLFRLFNGCSIMSPSLDGLTTINFVSSVLIEGIWECSDAPVTYWIHRP